MYARLSRVRSIFMYWRSHGLSVRASNCLLNGGIEHMPDLVAASEEDLMSIPGFGKGCLAEVGPLIAAHTPNPEPKE